MRRRLKGARERLRANSLPRPSEAPVMMAHEEGGPKLRSGTPGKTKREKNRRRRLYILETKKMNPVIVEVRRTKSVAFSTRVVVVSMCECNCACSKFVKDSIVVVLIPVLSKMCCLWLPSLQ